MKRIRTENGVENFTDEQVAEMEVKEKADRDAKLTYKEKRKPLYEEGYPDGDVKDIIMKQFNQWRLGGQPLIQEADDWVNHCLAVKQQIPEPKE